MKSGPITFENATPGRCERSGREGPEGLGQGRQRRLPYTQAALAPEREQGQPLVSQLARPPGGTTGPPTSAGGRGALGRFIIRSRVSR